MPVYRWVCPECSRNFELTCTIAEYEAFIFTSDGATCEDDHPCSPMRRIYDVSLIIPEGFHE